MKIQKRLLIICITVLVLTVGLFLIGLIKSNGTCKKVAFYNIPEDHKVSIIKELEYSLSKTVDIIELDSSIPMSMQEKKLKGVSLIFAISDSDNQNFALKNKKILPISQNFTENMAISIKSAIKQKNGKPAYIPFLYDMYQMDVNYNMYKNTSMPQINEWKDLIQVAEEELPVSPSPVIFTCTSDKEFLNIFGQLFEVFANFPAYEKFYNELYENFQKDMSSNFNTSFCADFIKDKMESDYDLKNTCSLLKEMINSGVINSQVLNFSENDTMFFCNNDLAGIVMFKLSDHRKISRETIGHYKSIYFPSRFMNDERKFASNEYSIMMLKNNRETQKVILDFTDNLQYELCVSTGLAPVQKNCKTPDHQADDVRFWLAASSGPLLPLSSAIPEGKTQETIANLLRY